MSFSGFIPTSLQLFPRDCTGDLVWDWQGGVVYAQPLHWLPGCGLLLFPIPVNEPETLFCLPTSAVGVVVVLDWCWQRESGKWSSIDTNQFSSSEIRRRSWCSSCRWVFYSLTHSVSVAQCLRVSVSINPVSVSSADQIRCVLLSVCDTHPSVVLLLSVQQQQLQGDSTQKKGTYTKRFSIDNNKQRKGRKRTGPNSTQQLLIEWKLQSGGHEFNYFLSLSTPREASQITFDLHVVFVHLQLD